VGLVSETSFHGKVRKIGASSNGDEPEQTLEAQYPL
jgi:hypothetical protein